MAHLALTVVQLRIFTIVATFIDTEGYPPTLREIAARNGTASTNWISDLLKQLQELGLLGSQYKKARALVLTTSGKELYQTLKGGAEVRPTAQDVPHS